MRRRALLSGAGTGLFGLVAGCLGNEPLEGSDDDDSNTSTTQAGVDDRPTDEPSYHVTLEDGTNSRVEGESATLEVDLLERAISERRPAVLEVRVTNTGTESIAVFSGAPAPFGVVNVYSTDEDRLTLWSAAYEESAYVGTDGKTVEGADDIAVSTFLEAGESFERSFEIHLESPNLEPGTYEGSIDSQVENGEGEDLRLDLEMRVDSVDADAASDPDGTADDVVTEEPRVDEPPYEIEPQSPPADEADDWDEHYLGRDIAEEPSLEFDPLDGVRPRETLAWDRNGTDQQFRVQALETASEVETVFDLEAAETDTKARLEDVDFERQCVLVVESGFGSGSVRHEWQRVEPADGVLEVHGYYATPFEQTDDITARHSVLVSDRPPETGFEYTRVFLTVDPDTRVRFNSTEGTVPVDLE